MAKKIDVNGLDHYHDKVSAMVADEYSSSATYAVGDYCFHAGTLYKCTTAITTAEAWTSGHWTAAKLAEDTSALKTALNVNDGVNILSGATWEIGSIKTNGANQSSTVRIRTAGFIDCGNFAKVNFTITNGYRFAAVWYDSTNTLIRDDYWLTTACNITLPTNAKYLRLVVGLVEEATASLAYANQITAKGAYQVNELLGEVNDYIGDVIFSRDVSGTKYVELPVALEAGKYLLHIDSITTTDTDSIRSWIAFVEPTLEDLVFELDRNKPINVFFELQEACTSFYVYAAEGASLSTGDNFTYKNLQIIKPGVLTDKINLLEKNRDIPYHNLETNPYQCDFQYFTEVISTTHAHCTTETQLVNLANVYDHVAISNYHPSVPFYPIEEFFPEPLKYVEYSNAEISATKYTDIMASLPSGEYVITAENVTSSDTDDTTCRILFYNGSDAVAQVYLTRGNNISAEFTTEADITHFYCYASSAAQLSTGDTLTITNLSVSRKVTGVYDNFLCSPNAEQAGFPHYDASFHINSVGSYLSKETENNNKSVYDTISNAINSLQFSQMGGITINHPTYSSLTGADIVELMKEYRGIFALEIYNCNSEASSGNGYALTQWDYALAHGVQIYGVAVPDHEVQNHPTENRGGFGYCHVMVRAKTEQQILHAYSCGRFYTSIYNDTLKFTNLFYKPSAGFTVETSESATIKFITANGTVSTQTGTTATYVPTYNDVYVRVEATDGTNTLYSNAVML